MVIGKKVLSIQSHVVHGYVGNKAASFPLQCKGWDVDALNTVQFSNHPAYGFISGFKSNSDDLESIIEDGLVGGLKMKYNAVLTGYLPDTEGLRKIGKVVRKMCEDDRDLKWLLDPVLGDDGKLYVPEATVAIYEQILRDGSVFLATPNQFELEILTGFRIFDLASLKSTMKRFHELYPKVCYLVVTSVDFESDNFVSTCTDFTDYWYFTVPRIKAHFSGSGDLFSAILMDLLLSSKDENVDLPLALNKALSLVDEVLQRTYDLTLKPTQESEQPFRINDLKIIQCKDLFRNVYVAKFKCNKL